MKTNDEILQTALGDMLAEYVRDNDNEREDFERHCDENELDPINLGPEHLRHIMGVALFYMHHSGYDITPYKVPGSKS